MTFPAWDAFEADDRARTRHVRTYRALRRLLDFRQIREPKLDRIARHANLKKQHVWPPLRDLIAWGYVHEWGRDKYGTRRLTLAWSVAVTETVTTGSSCAV